MTQFLAQQCDDTGIMTLTLARPDKRNALHMEMIQELQQALAFAAADKAVHVVVLRGEGSCFCAGADISWMQQQGQATTAENQAGALELAALLKQLHELPKPTIGIAHGNNFGGGVGLLACCDMVVAAHDASFCFSEVKLGLVPATIAPYVLHAMGRRQAQSLFLSAQSFNTSEAWHYGLVTHKVNAQADVAVSAHELARRCARNGPQAMATVKAMLQQHTQGERDLATRGAEVLAEVRQGEEAKQRIQAFFDAKK